MDFDSFVPQNGGSLHDLAAPAIREPVATFTLTRAMHPDEIWSPRGGDLAPSQRSVSPAPDYYAGAESERPVPASHMGETPLVGNLVSVSRTAPGSTPVGSRGLGLENLELRR